MPKQECQIREGSGYVIIMKYKTQGKPILTITYWSNVAEDMPPVISH